MARETRTAEDLSLLFRKIDHHGYKAYKELRGTWAFRNFNLIIDHVQGDPFAAPSRVRVRVPMELAGFPGDTYRGMGEPGALSENRTVQNPSRSREIALRDFLTRQFGRACRSGGKVQGRGRSGSGKSGLIEIDLPGQEVIERSSCFVNDRFVEVRFVVGLPAFGRRIAGGLADELLLRRVPDIVEKALFFEKLDQNSRDQLYHAVETAEDADALRMALAGSKLVAFVADGAILPRRSGVDERPMSDSEAIPFIAPDSLRVAFNLPNRGRITGMGIPRGVTLIVGGGYHGKSTLLNAIQQGVYNHFPGDGREFVVTNPLAFKIRAEDGRRIEKTSITPFISNLPYGRDTDVFSSENASGSTSQAANIIEGVEAGASALLIDEDTSATNFMIRDHRMQELVAKENEPITPFIDKVGQLFSEQGVSTLLVIGGSGDYFDVADLVIGMNAYVPQDVTDEAKRIAEKYRSERAREGGEGFGRFIERAPLPSGIDPRRGRREVKLNIRGARLIDFGIERIDLSAVEQLIHPGQARSIAAAMIIGRELMDGHRSIAEILDLIMEELEKGGLDVLSGSTALSNLSCLESTGSGGAGTAGSGAVNSRAAGSGGMNSGGVNSGAAGSGGVNSGVGRFPGDLVRFRRLELAAALNRLRSFRVRQLSGEFSSGHNSSG